MNYSYNKQILRQTLLMHLSNEKISLLCRPDGEVLGQLRTFRGENAYIIPDDIGIDAYKRVVIQLESYMKLRGIECTDKEGSQQAAGNGPQVIQSQLVPVTG